MDEPYFSPYYPEHFLRGGLFLLGTGILCSMLLGFFCMDDLVGTEENGEKRSGVLLQEPLDFRWVGFSEERSFEIPEIRSELSCFSLPSRPGGNVEEKIEICLKSSSQRKEVPLPSQEELAFNEAGLLVFSKGGMLLSLKKQGKQLQAHLEVCDPFLKKKQQQCFLLPLQKRAPFSLGELPVGGPFQSLFQSRWMGRDLLMEKEPVQTIEIGSFPNVKRLDLCAEDFLVFIEGEWQIARDVEAWQGPIARICSEETRSLILEGWDERGSYCWALNKNFLSKVGSRKETLLHSVRIRSLNQISCFIEKQPFVLRVGDWVIKEYDRWKSVKDKEKIKQKMQSGELFILDRLEKQKNSYLVAGRVFSQDRCEMNLIEVSIPLKKKNQKRRAG